ncbi:MAG: Ig-like domain-containing protein, partial [Myxococcota bacterium]
WSFTTSTLADGSHTVRATATDAAGNTSANSNTNTFTVDTAAPAAPVVTAPANGSTTNDSTPTYTGTAEPNSLVAISVDGFLVGTATTNASGQWSFTPTSPLSDGSHTVRAAATDAGGSTSIDSAPSTFIVDTRAPAAPVVTAPADGSTTGDNTPTVTGTAEPNATVSIFIDGVQVGTVTANGSGAWTFTTSALTDGAHTVRATATDAAGNASQTSSTSTFTVDTGAPTAPVVTAPADQSTTTDTTPTITGTSEPNATITIVIDGQQVGTTTANASGAWTFTASTLTLGQHTVSARATDSSGNSSPTSTANTFTVLPFPPAVPTLSSPSDGSIGSDTTPTFSGTAEPGSTVTVRVDGEIVCTATATASGDFSCTPTVALREGAHVVTASAANAGGSSAESTANRFIIDATAPLTPVVVGPANQSTTTDTTPAIVGTGEPGSTIDVRIDGASVGSTTVAADGTWSFTPAALSLGAHTVSARATDVAGNPSLPSNTNTFTVVAPSAARPTLDQPADNSALDTAQPTFSGTAPAGAMVTVRVDGVPVCTATATMAGTWTCSPATPLAEGPHRATAETSDGQGGALTSNTNSFSVDTRAPAAPVVTRPANGSVTDDTTPELGGTAEPLTTVAVFVDGLQLGTAAVDVDGRWSLTPSSPLALGMHTVTATSTDRAGNTSSTSTAASFTIVAPGSTPFVLAPAPGSSTSDATPLISGTATPGATVEALVDGVVVCTAVATNSGAWSCAPTTPLTEGRHDVTAREQGATTTSPAVPFVVDTIAPATPTISSPQPNAHTGALPTLSGTAEPGARVEVKVDGAPVCVTLADATGAWSCVPPTPLSMGAHTVSATATDVAGNTSMPAGPVPFTVDETPPDAPAITAPAAGSSTTDTTPTFSGTAEPGSIVTVRVDGMVACVTTATSSGTFSCDATAELPRGTHEVTATATDAGGNTSTASTAVSFSVIPVTPPAPAITGPAEGTLVSMSSVVISGTAQPGTTVTVREGSTVVCTATVSASGAWSCTAASLTDGPHQFTATASDDGVESQPSPPRTIAVDTTPPVVDVTGAPVVPTNETTTTVQWQTEPGTTYQCSIDGGAFTDCTSPTTLNGLAPGEHSITVRATDEAGNVTETTTTWLVEEPARWSLAGTGISCTSAPLGSLAPLALILVLRRRKRQG